MPFTKAKCPFGELRAGATQDIILLILMITWFPNAEKRKAFTWRWSIPLIGVLIVMSDCFYFKALQDPDALIMLLSAI